MLEIEKYGDFKGFAKEKKKYQIILAHTSRNIDDYLMSLKHRYSGKFKRIPNYIITKEGKILQLLSNIEYSEYFDNLNINRHSIIICLENLGWLQKEPLTDYYINWIGDIYNGKVYEKKWRDYYFWHPYTKNQIDSTSDLCKKLFEDMSIKHNLVGHNTKINGVERFEGIVSKSNFDSEYTDMNPSFNFEEFLKKIENE